MREANTEELIERINSLSQELEQLKAEQLKDAQVTYGVESNLRKEILDLEKQNQKYKEALEFYSHRDTWINYGTIALEDSGTIARVALDEGHGQ